MIGKVIALVPAELRGHTPRFLVLLVLLALSQVAAYLLAIPLLRALFEGDLDSAWRWTGWLALAVAVASVFAYLQSMVGLKIGVGMLRGVQTRLGDHLAALPLGWFGTTTSGSISRVIVGNVREIIGVFTHLLAPVLNAVLVPLGVAIGVAFVDWRVSVAMLISLPVLFVVSRWANASYSRANDSLHEAAAESNSRVVEFAQAQPVLRAFGATGESNRGLDAALHGHQRAARGLVFASVPGLMAFALCVQAAFLLVVGVIVGRATGGALAVPAAVALIAVSARFIDPLNQAAQLSNALRSAGDAADRITGLLAETQLAEAQSPVQPVDSSLEYRGVGFGYGDGPAVLDDISFVVPSGTTTAIVGPSGSGKTTLLRLASRFYEVRSGSISVGGFDVREQPSETLMRQVSLVFQDVYLFDRSIEDNIRVGDPEASTEQIRAAARLARVDEIVDRLPDGWDTIVGEGGATLSGGERQRVSIARAMLKDAPIVLLDEATSALDPHNEAVVVRGVHELSRDKTVVVVAHRLSTIAHADQTLFVDSGRIQERGTHDELLRLGGRYAAFWNERSRGSGWHLAAHSSADAVGQADRSSATMP